MYPTLLSPFYANDAAFDESERQSAMQLCLMMDGGPDWGYFPNLAKLLFITNNPEDKEAKRQELDRADRLNSKLCRW